MDNIENIRNAISGLKTETFTENRPDINKKLLNDLIEAYDNLTYIDFAVDKYRTISMLHTVASIKRFVEIGEPEQAHLRLRSMFLCYT